METLIEAQQKILTELTVDDPKVREDFLKLYEAKAVQISEHLSKAVMAWRDLDATAGQNERRAYLSALVFTALTLQVQSTKLFLSGYIVAAGNVFRQAVETTALSLVCSGASLNVLDRFVGDKYSTNDAVRDVLRIPREAGPRFRGMSVQHSAACRSTIPRDVGPVR